MRASTQHKSNVLQKTMFMVKVTCSIVHVSVKFSADEFIEHDYVIVVGIYPSANPLK